MFMNMYDQYRARSRSWCDTTEKVITEDEKLTYCASSLFPVVTW